MATGAVQCIGALGSRYRASLSKQGSITGEIGKRKEWEQPEASAHKPVAGTATQ